MTQKRSLAAGGTGGLDDAQAAVFGQQVGVDEVHSRRRHLLQDALQQQPAGLASAGGLSARQVVTSCLRVESPSRDRAAHPVVWRSSLGLLTARECTMLAVCHGGRTLNDQSVQERM